MSSESRTYFLANVCHVCKSKNTFYACEICRMIYYCSPEHRRSNWFEHSELCWAINKICRDGDLWDLYDGKDFAKFRHEVANKCSELMKRCLKPWELEMIYHPRMCNVCRRRKNLSLCKNCEFVFTCERNHFRKDHRKWCETMKLYSDLIIDRSLRNGHDGRLPELEVKNENNKSMADILEQYCEFKNNKVQKALASELLTYPLTVLHGLKTIKSLRKRKLAILFIGAEVQAEVEPLAKWEKYLLHPLSKTEFLSLKFLGPELWKTDEELSEDLCETCRELILRIKCPFISSNVLEAFLACSKISCSKEEGPRWPLISEITLYEELSSCQMTIGQWCFLIKLNEVFLKKAPRRNQNKTLKFQFISRKFFHEYSSNETEKPDLICAFNSGMYRDFGFGNMNSWKETILKLFARGNSPVIITEYTWRELEMVLEKIRSFYNDVTEIVPPEMNPFASLKPGLNIISENEIPVIFKNYYSVLLQRK